jgi:hypothetical protein
MCSLMRNKPHYMHTLTKTVSYLVISPGLSAYINTEIKFIFNLKGQFLSNPILSLSLAVCLFSVTKMFTIYLSMLFRCVKVLEVRQFYCVLSGACV